MSQLGRWLYGAAAPLQLPGKCCSPSYKNRMAPGCAERQIRRENVGKLWCSGCRTPVPLSIPNGFVMRTRSRLHLQLATSIAALVVFMGLFMVADLGFGTEKHPPIPAPMLEDKTASAATGGVCVICHTDRAKLPEVHSVIAQAGCPACHEVAEQQGRWTVKPLAEGNELCFLCHDNKKPQPPAPGIRNHQASIEGACLACHDPHESQYPFLLPGPVDNASENNFCFTCHADVSELAKKKTVHGVLQMGCLTCHQTHKGGAAGEQEFAFHLTKSTPALCLDCHAGDDAQLASAHASQPFQAAACTNCHDAHGSDMPKLIFAQAHAPYAAKQCEACHVQPKEGKVALIEEGKPALCFTCHTDKQEQLSAAKVKHSLFGIEDTCTNCHSSHASDQPGELRQPLRALCGSCHEEQAYPKGIVHKPLEMDQGCDFCHDPHASDFPSHLWAEVNTLCLGCHGTAPPPEQPQADVVLFGKVRMPADLFAKIKRIPITAPDSKGHPYVGHPVSGEIKEVPERGNMTCVSCHRPHGVKQGKSLLVTESEASDSICFNCHNK